MAGIKSLGEKVREKKQFKYLYKREQTSTLERVAGFLEVSTWLMYAYSSKGVPHSKQLNV